MDKKTRKHIQVLKDRLRNRHQRLSGARQQADEIDEVERVKTEIASIEAALRHWNLPACDAWSSWNCWPR
ncbi:MAG TPA: hypothetical protein VLI39_11595 [Sedimentisphaerales bacterium]|nr:hypothetical protein [Sedimentisphaerales bacterium]